MQFFFLLTFKRSTFNIFGYKARTVIIQFVMIELSLKKLNKFYQIYLILFAISDEILFVKQHSMFAQ